MKELINEITQLEKRIKDALAILKIDKEEEKLESLQKETEGPDFWNREDAKKVMQEVSFLEKKTGLWRGFGKEVSELKELVLIVGENEHELISEIGQKYQDLFSRFEKQEFELFMSGPYDKNNTLLSVYAGSGGVDAQDWAEMLLSMYLKYAQRMEFSAKILEISLGEEAGIKSVTVEIDGPYAFGYLKSERGVHRLVRLSPYDADKARHTSFALVETLPIIEEEKIDLKDDDLRIDVFRSQGAGGQSVNTTDSAVRITHIPTGIVATCQNERSQLQNKLTALKILKSKLLHLMAERHKETIEEIRGETVAAEWGNQIRSYVIHPYKMVKDHRTGFESPEPDKVLAGEIDEFIEAFLRKEKTI